MENGRFLRALVVAATFPGATAVFADAPAPAHARTKKARRPVAPRVTLTCKTDDDCAPTKMADGDCCPSLCQPRIVSKKSADALAKYAAVCKKPTGDECPAPECAPPQTAVQAACVSGKCVAHAAPTPSRE
jgi:hypothetical protein